MEVLALLVGGPREPRRYTSLAEARDDYRWYQHNGERDADEDGEVVGWAWTGDEAGDTATADWVLRRGPRGGLHWDRSADPADPTYPTEPTDPADPTYPTEPTDPTDPIGDDSDPIER